MEISYAIPYICIFLTTFLFSIKIYNQSISIRILEHFELFCAFAMVVIFFGFRGFLYTDYGAYYPYFNGAPALFDDTNLIHRFLFVEYPSWEKGFKLYTIVCKTIFDNYFFLQFVSFIIDFALFIKILKYYEIKNTLLSLVVFFAFAGFLIEFNLLRNSKSIFLFIYSLRFIDRKNWVKYYCVNAVGFLFHTSALVYMPLYFILPVRYKKWFKITLFIISVTILLARIKWVMFFLTSILKFFDIGRLGDLVETYSNYFPMAKGISAGTIERIITFIMLITMEEKILAGNRKILPVINCLYIFLYCQFLFTELYTLVERIGVLFIFSYWLLYPKIYENIGKKYKCLLLCFVLFYGGMKIVAANTSATSNYRLSFFEHSYNERHSLAEEVTKKIRNNVK